MILSISSFKLLFKITDDGNNGGKDSSCNNVGTCEPSTKKCTCDMEFKGVDCTKLGEISI